jgi:hypothetical protein
VSVRVNLLPEATKQRSRASQQRAVAGLAGVVLLAGLGAVYWVGAAQIRTAEDELAAEQARTSQLRGEEAELIAFRELADRRDRSDELLRTALGGEVSVAGLLQDVAAVMPTDTQLETLTVQISGPTDGGSPAVGSFNATGKTLSAHAPGVERVLIQLDKVVSFSELYLNSSTLDDPEGRVATFSLDGIVGQEALTQRYVGGLPEELR